MDGYIREIAFGGFAERWKENRDVKYKALSCHLLLMAVKASLIGYEGSGRRRFKDW